MRRLTIRQRFSLLFGLYIFVFLLIFLGIFFVSYRLMLTHQLRSELSAEVAEIIPEFITNDNGKLGFRLDPDGKSLREHLINESISGIIYTKDLALFKAYGLFAVAAVDNNDQSIATLADTRAAAQESYSTNSILFSKTYQSDQSLSLISAPIIIDSQALGVVVLGKPLGILETFTNLTLSVLAISGGFSVLGSLMLGYILAKQAYMPLRKIVQRIDEVNLDRLDKKLSISGHPSDEPVMLAQKFNQMLSRLKVMSEKQKEFIANASHELKTPLTTAVTTLETLKVPTHVKIKIDWVREDLMDISRLIDKLLFLSRERTGSLRSSKNVLLIPTVNKLKRLLEKELANKQLQLQTDISPKFEVTIPKEYLEMLLTNLLTNAIKFSHKKSEINVIATIVNGQPQITVKNYGLGLSINEVKHIFRRFYRGKNARDTAGAGIGMAMVKQICQMYDIEISVKTQLNKLTVITLRFPNKI